MSELSQIEAIQSTCYDAYNTKKFCVFKNYYKDNFIFEFDKSKEIKKFLPLINRGTYCRYFIINNPIYGILDIINNDEDVNIIVLGSGYETLFFNLVEKGYKKIKFYEFDFKEVLTKKSQHIKNSNKIQSMLNNIKNIDSEYNLISGDITDIQKLTNEINKIKKNNLTILIGECLFTYIENSMTAKIIKLFYDYFENLVLLQYDLINSDDLFGSEMIKNLSYRNINLIGLKTCKDLQAQKTRNLECGFKEKDIHFHDMLYVYNKLLSDQERARINSLEMMDEFEEFNLLLSHACFGYSYKLEEKYSKITEVLNV